MGDKDPIAITVDLLDHHRDKIASRKAVAGVSNAGHRDTIHRQQRGNPAADIYKRPEGLQVGHPGGDNVPGPQSGNVVPCAFFLGGTSGQESAHPSPFPHKARHLEAHRFAYTGNHGDILELLLTAAAEHLLPGDDSFHAAQVHMKGQTAVT